MKRIILPNYMHENVVSVIAFNEDYKELVAEAAANTVNGQPEDIKLETEEHWIRWFKSEHSPIRRITISVTGNHLSDRLIKHITRHHIGFEKFVSTRREDRTDNPEALYRAIFDGNPQAWINVARHRLCANAHEDVRGFVKDLKQKLLNTTLPLLDMDVPMLHALGHCMVPDCEYRGGLCYQFKSCGKYPKGV